MGMRMFVMYVLRFFQTGKIIQLVLHCMKFVPPEIKLMKDWLLRNMSEK